MTIPRPRNFSMSEAVVALRDYHIPDWAQAIRNKGQTEALQLSNDDQDKIALANFFARPKNLRVFLNNPNGENAKTLYYNNHYQGTPDKGTISRVNTLAPKYFPPGK